MRQPTFSRRNALAALSALAVQRRGAAGASFVPYLIGANTAIAGYGLFEAIGLLRKLGFRTIEVQNLVGQPEGRPGEFPGFHLARADAGLKRRIREALAPFDCITTHLPYTGLEYFAPRGPKAEESMRTLEMALQATAFLQAKVAVLHAKPAPGMTIERSWPLLLERLRRWGDFAQRNSFRIGVETGYPASVKDFVRLIREVAHPAVGATIDVGHQARYAELQSIVRPEQRGSPEAARAYNQITMAILEQLGPKVIHFHVHDIEPATWKEHQPLRYGFVDYPRLLARLLELNYQGVFVLEIAGPAGKMPEYLSQARQTLEGFLAGLETGRTGR